MSSKNLSDVEKIEYYLGKDSYRDIYFGKKFPAAYDKINVGHVAGDKATVDQLPNTVQRLNAYEPEITYAFNNLSYRSDFDYHVDDLLKREVIVCLGDTDTFGMALKKEDTWVDFIARNNPDKAVLNCGIIGAAPDTVSRVMVGIVNAIGPAIKGICILWPHTNRREFVSKLFTGIVGGTNRVYVPFEDYWDFIDWKSDNHNYFRNKHLTDNLAKANGIPLFDLLVNRFDDKVPFDYGTKFYALGKKSHAALGQYFHKKLNGLPSLYEEKK